jgi:hypothetical protein
MFVSLGVCLLTFAPLVLITWHFGDALTWALASMLLGVGSIVYLLYARPASRHLRRDRPGLVPTWASAVFIAALRRRHAVRVSGDQAAELGGVGPTSSALKVRARLA